MSTATAVEMIPVQSSNIVAIGYVDDGIIVEFKGGSRYLCRGASSGLFAEFQASESKGRFYATEIKAKPDVYKVEKLARAEQEVA